jgi:hypothetical protein
MHHDNRMVVDGGLNNQAEVLISSCYFDMRVILQLFEGIAGAESGWLLSEMPF